MIWFLLAAATILVWGLYERTLSQEELEDEFCSCILGIGPPCPWEEE